MASINLQSKDGGGDDGARSSIRSQGAASPWANVVRGEFDEVLPPVVSVTAPAPSSSSVQEQIVEPSSDCYPPKAATETETSLDGSGSECLPEGSDNGGGGSNAVKKPVWSKPSNGVIEAVSPVMGAVSWPALGESKKASPKSSSSESLQALSDGSLQPALPVTRNSSPSPLKLANVYNMSSTSTPNHVAAFGQRSMRRGGGSLGAYIPSNRGVSQRPPANQVEAPYVNTGTVAVEPYQRDHTHRESHGGFGSQGNNHHHQRNLYRRGNGGQHPRGDGYYQGRGNQEWNQYRSFNNRDANGNMQHHRGGFRRGYPRPPVQAPTQLMHQQTYVPMRFYGNNVIYPGMAQPQLQPQLQPHTQTQSVYYIQGQFPPEHFIPAPMPGPFYYSFQDPVLNVNIMNQIEYYFSNDNLVRDTYLRQQMDKDGWVPVDFIANFKKVMSLTNNISLILDSMRASTIVEVQGNKLRRRNDWKKWLLPPTVQHSTFSSPASTPRAINQDTLALQLQGMGLEDATSKGEASSSGSSSSGESHK